MPDVSELARLWEERDILKDNLKTHLYRDKHTKQHLLNKLRDIERQLGVELSDYNSPDF